MKYIVTWVLIETFFVPRQDLLSERRTIRTVQKQEFSDKKKADEFFDSKKKEIDSQFQTYPNGMKVIPCPKCWKYEDEIKIDSVKN